MLVKSSVAVIRGKTQQHLKISWCMHGIKTSSLARKCYNNKGHRNAGSVQLLCALNYAGL